MSRNARLQLVFLVLLLAGLLPAAADDYYSLPPTNATARVVEVQGHDLLSAFLPNPARVAAAFNRGLLAFTRKTAVKSAWLSLVHTNDIVGIKVFSAPGPLSGTRPAVVAPIVRGLLAAGVPPRHIIIWDKHAYDLQAAGFFALGRKLGVRVVGAMDAGYDPKTFYLPETPITGTLVWGDLQFGEKGPNVGKKSFVTKLLSQQITKIISVAPLINNDAAGLCGHLYSMALGSVDNTRRFEGHPGRLSVALPEIYALPAVGDHVVLLVTDALLGQYQGGPASYLQYSSELNQIWFSHDPVALDVLGLKQLARERKEFGARSQPANFQIYQNASILQLGISDPSQILVQKVH